LAVLYGVDLKKIMGINVAFDIVDNTDDYEPVRAVIKVEGKMGGNEAKGRIGR